MPHRKAAGIKLIKEGVQMLLDLIKDQQKQISDLQRINHSYEITEREDKEKIGKLRLTVRAQQAGLQEKQPSE